MTEKKVPATSKKIQTEESFDIFVFFCEMPSIIADGIEKIFTLFDSPEETKPDEKKDPQPSS